MLPFGLKVLWFFLSLTGLLSCWVTLWSFSRVVRVKWPSVVYCVGTTFSQVMFCLGIIYGMNPNLMPGPFCFAQNAFNVAGGFIGMGVVLALTLATWTAVRKPKTWGDATQALQWQTHYCFPLVVLPVIGTACFLATYFSFGHNVDHFDGMWCNATGPEWARLPEPSGIPFLLSIPILYLSVQSFFRVRKTNLHLLRSRPECQVSPAYMPCLSRTGSTRLEISCMQVVKRIFFKGGLDTKKAESTTDDLRKNGIVRSSRTSSVHNETMNNWFQASLPPAPIPTALLRHTGIDSPRGDEINTTLEAQDTSLDGLSTLSFKEGDVDLEDLRYNVSKVFSTSAPNSRRESYSYSIKLPSKKDRVFLDKNRITSDVATERSFRIEMVDLGSAASRSPNLNNKRLDSDMIDETDGAKVSLESLNDIELVSQKTEDMEARRKGRQTIVLTLDGPYKRPSRQPAWLAPALWQVMLFQLAFVFIQFLPFVTTIIEMASRHSSPPCFGMPDLALLLAAWCPVFIFGALPDVRRNLIPWRPISIP